MSLSAEIIDRLIPEKLPTVEELEAKYPPRQLTEGAKVVRYAPSPTGYMHVGNFYSAFVNERLGHQSGGVFFIRIEDTDQKREMEGAADLIFKTMADYGLKVDEGSLDNGKDVGAYGPYTQSKRREIYRACVKHLLKEGKAYPCFVTSEELDELRKSQEYQNIRPGYYGKYALHRDLTEDQVKAFLDAGKKFIFRLRSPGNGDKWIKVDDLIKGERQLPEWDEDTIIYKGDGLPTYHFAHLVDDHFMRTTHVVRGEEWFSSLPRHVQLFQVMGWKAPRYAHISFIQKLDNGNRRKLSKRSDPEATMTFYAQKGYTPVALKEYLLNLMNSNFEDWRKANPTKPYEEFTFAINKMGESGALLDLVKLDNISKEVISKMTADEVFNAALAWAKLYDPKLQALMEGNAAYVKQILSIERTGAKIRKDIATWSAVYGELEYFFDEHFTLTKEKALELLAPTKAEDAAQAAKLFIEGYNPADDKDTWFGKVKQIAEGMGYATNAKDFQKNPAAYKGNVSDVAKIFRVLLTGRAQTPDLHSVMLVMGKDRCAKRLALVG